MSSPLVKDATVKTIDKIDTSKICDLYKSKFDIDVSRFFTDLDTIEIRECTVSKYKYYYPYTLEGDSDFYDELSKKLPYYSERKWQFDQAKKVIKQGDTVLDIGCGGGIFLDGLKSITPNLFGLEFNPEAIKLCKEKGIQIYSEDLKDISKTNKAQFDVITYFQVLEHITDVHAFIQDSINLLKPGGKLIIAVPNNNPYIYKHEKFHVLNLPPHHLGLWNEEALAYLPNIFDLSVVNVLTEPLDSFNNWFKVQVRNALGFYPLPEIKVVNFLLRKIGQPFGSQIKGRNIIAIYDKTK